MLTILNPLHPAINIHETFFLSRNLGSLNQLGKISEGIQEFTKAPPCTQRASKLDLGSYFCCSLISSLQMNPKKIKPWPLALWHSMLESITRHHYQSPQIKDSISMGPIFHQCQKTWPLTSRWCIVSAHLHNFNLCVSYNFYIALFMIFNKVFAKHETLR